MKSLFNFENYRKNLADDLKKDRNNLDTESARKKLTDAQKSPEYTLSKMLKIISRRLENDMGESIPEKFPIEVLEYDISNKVPDSIKMFLDLKKIDSLGSLYNKEAYMVSKSDSYNDSVKFKIWQSAFDDLKKRGEISDYEQFDKNMPYKYMGILITNVINELTQGAYSDKKMINTGVFGYGSDGIFEPRLGRDISGGDGFNKNYFDLKYGINFDPNSYIVNPTQKIPSYTYHKEHAITKEKAVPINLWFAPGKEGGNQYFSPERGPLVIVDPTKERFLNFVKVLKLENERIEVNKENIKEMKDFQSKVFSGNTQTQVPVGLQIGIDEKGTRWTDIADYIVDLLAMKVYQINDITENISSAK